eukprot:gnl/TRDRNA2_/TRDRNA2_175786_c1_seq10.p1 gnl/TRDRNA2_/TRDRNA2_175786_c1~~gnl/TRDRNA2_/TRDRNA2_175786_c1_seq10.p1  ORF type:complete len:170 (+),score=15.34 gnl/TRDRNA2_/TRDRNA2_175786_c1_seq10:149-658(+)
MEALFFRSSLMANLIYGVPNVDASDRSMRRITIILRRVGVPQEVINMTVQGVQDNWSEVLSHTQRHMLCLARAFITNPEVLCIHKPTVFFGKHTSRVVMDLLREFVENKGLEQDMSTFKLRRCRTCITTAQDRASAKRADTIWMINDAGVALVDDINTIEERHFCNRQE